MSYYSGTRHKERCSFLWKDIISLWACSGIICLQYNNTWYLLIVTVSVSSSHHFPLKSVQFLFISSVIIAVAFLQYQFSHHSLSALLVLNPGVWIVIGILSNSTYLRLGRKRINSLRSETILLLYHTRYVASSSVQFEYQFSCMGISTWILSQVDFNS